MLQRDLQPARSVRPFFVLFLQHHPEIKRGQRQRSLQSIVGGGETLYKLTVMQVFESGICWFWQRRGSFAVIS
jgi:hypothetical protein